jgi:hypothetical protein
MKTLARGLLSLVLLAGAVAGAAAQETPSLDLGGFIQKNHLHQIAGGTTVALALATGTAALLGWEGHPILGYSTLGAGAITLSLGLTAFSDRLDEVWPHAVLMGLAETGWALNAFVLEPGSLPHKITGAASLVSLAGAIVAIVLING